MQTIKLHEATKQFKISNKLAMFFLGKNNVPVKSHSSVISMDQLELLREFSDNKEKFSAVLDEFNRIEKEKKKKTKKTEPEKEGKEKHVPTILVTDSCGLIPDECRDVHVKVGSVPHPMADDHSIMWIDTYVNKAYSARYYMMPQNMQPALGLHLKTGKTGTLTIVSNCNKHGSWMAEANF